MPNWKKVVTSGSVAHLARIIVDSTTYDGANIAAPGDFEFDVAGDITLDADGGDITFKDGFSTTLGGVNNSGIFSNNHITASGNISASGDIYGNGYHIGDRKLAFASSTDSKGISFGNDGDGNLELTHITASGNISSSGGTIDAGVFKIDGNNALNMISGVVTFGQHIGDLQIGKNPTQTTLKVAAHITASGNISASGTITSLNSTIVGTATIGTYKASADGAAIQGSNGEDYIQLNANNLLEMGDPSGAANGTVLKVDDNNSKITLSSPVSIGTETPATNMELTVAGDISASADVYGNRGNFPNKVVTNLVASSANTEVHINDNLKVTGQITASGDISSSGGDIFSADKFKSQGVDVIDGGSTTRIGAYQGANILRGNSITTEGYLSVAGAITASGDISSSGYVQTDTIYGSGSYLNFKNDTSNPSELRLYCEANSHYIGIRGPVHSGASSYVLKLPNDAPSDNQILKVNGSPSGGEVTLAWEADADSGGGGGSVAGSDTQVQFNDGGSFGGDAGLVYNKTTDTLTTTGNLIVGDLDNGAFISASGAGNVEISGSGRGQLEVDYRLFDTGSSHLTSAGGGVGDIVKFGGTSTTAGDIYYLKTDGTWGQARANAVGTSTGSLAVALGSNSTTDGMLLKGMVKLDNDPSATMGNPVFLDDTAAGHARNDAPDTGGDVVRIVGHYYSGSGLIYFNPDNTFIEVA